MVEKYYRLGLLSAIDHSTEEANTEDFWEENMKSKIKMFEQSSKVKGVTFIPLKVNLKKS